MLRRRATGYRREITTLVVAAALLFGIVWIVWGALDDVPKFYGVSNSPEPPSAVFDDLRVGDDVRAQSLDEYFRRFAFVTSDETHDISYGRWPEFSLKMQVRLATTNPRPIWMYQTRNNQAMLRYQAESSMETNERRIFRTLLKRAPSSSFVMDVGSNDGFYTLLSAAYGHRVAAFEPQPNCAAVLYMSIAFNRFKHTPKLFQRVASSGNRTFEFPKSAPCLGTTGFSADDADRVAKDVIQSLDPAKVLEANGNRSVLLHVDVEGAEINVLRDLAAHIGSGQIDNVVFESVPARWSRFGVSVAEGLVFLRRLFKDMTCRNVGTLWRLDQREFETVEGDIWCSLRDIDVPLDAVDPTRRLPSKLIDQT